MTWRQVFERDLRSVYRSRTGTAVASLLALFTVFVVGLVGLAENFELIAAVGTLVTVAVLLVLVFVGTPRTVAAFVAAFTVAALGLVGLVANGASPPEASRFILVFLSGSLSLLLPLVGLLAAYNALVGERSTGSVRFLLGLPNSRDDVYLAKYLGRSVVVAAPLVVGMALAGVLAVATFADGSFLAVFGLGLVSVPYALVFVGIGLSASAVAETETRAVTMVIAVFAVLRAGWPGLQWLAIQSIPRPQRHPRPEWFFWFGRVNPINAYVRLTTEFGELSEHPLVATNRGPATFATTAEFAAVVLVAWGALAPLVGLWYFRRRDML